jgi:hypothetical protein
MNVERLKELTKLLSTIPETNFNLSAWSRGENLKNIPQQQLIDCETVCCAVGWACSHPPFIEQGLHWDKCDYPAYENSTSWSAVEAFFDIPTEVAEYLFLDDSYCTDDATPQDVIDRINDIIEDSELYDFITNQ